MISALANAAALVGKAFAYLVWGVRDEDHALVRDDVRPHHASAEPAADRRGGVEYYGQDAKRIELGLNCEIVGMSEIKRRRLEELEEIPCHPGNELGSIVPFYFCPRSIMLYVIHCANHSDLAYRGGQGRSLHLEADLHRVVPLGQCTEAGCWAFSLSNAGAGYATIPGSQLGQLGEVNWSGDCGNAISVRPTSRKGSRPNFSSWEELSRGSWWSRIGVQVGGHTNRGS